MGLKHLFGDKPIPLIFDFFIVHKQWDYSLADVSKATKVSYRTLQRLIPKLVEKNILLPSRMEGRAQMYVLNTKSSIVKKLDELSYEADLSFAKSQNKTRSKNVNINLQTVVG